MYSSVFKCLARRLNLQIIKQFSLNDIKLLIVEDSLSVRRILKSAVAPPAMEITECGDGVDPVSLQAGNRPDFVMMDIDLNEMDGIIATRQIGAGDPNAKIIVVTNCDIQLIGVLG